MRPGPRNAAGVDLDVRPESRGAANYQPGRKEVAVFQGHPVRGRALGRGQELEARRNIFFAGIQTVKAFESFRPGGAFYVWSKISPDWPGYQGRRDSWAMTNYLIDQIGVGTSPGIAFGSSGEGYVRFAFTLDRRTLTDSIEVMQDLFK